MSDAQHDSRSRTRGGPLRLIVVAAIVLSTAGFVVGTSIERGQHETHAAAASGTASPATTAAASETTATAHSESGTTGEAAKSGEAAAKSVEAAAKSVEAAAKTGEAAATGKAATTGESAAHLAAESSTGHVEFRPFGVNIEAIPFIVLAAFASLALAGVAWVRPQWRTGLILIAAAMALFAVLDVREVVHQSDEGRTGLELLAALVAALHAAAAGAALALTGRARDQNAARA